MITPLLGSLLSKRWSTSHGGAVVLVDLLVEIN